MIEAVQRVNPVGPTAPFFLVFTSEGCAVDQHADEIPSDMTSLVFCTRARGNLVSNSVSPNEYTPGTEEELFDFLLWSLVGRVT